MFDSIRTPFGPVFLESEKSNSTGIAFSGGVESTLLLFMLCDRNQAPDKVFHIQVTDVEMLRSRMILDLINKRFNLNLTLEIHGRYGDTHYLGPDMKALSELVDVLYCANNALPALPDFIGPRPAYKSRVRVNLRPSVKSKIAQPFAAYDKRLPLSLYKKYDIMDLYQLTWSCDVDDAIEQCGVCYSCLDKTWAESHTFND